MATPAHRFPSANACPAPEPAPTTRLQDAEALSPPGQADVVNQLLWSRIAIASDDLARAEDVNLATASGAELVRGYEELRDSLFDVIQVAKQALRRLEIQGP